MPKENVMLAAMNTTKNFGTMRAHYHTVGIRITCIGVSVDQGGNTMSKEKRSKKLTIRVTEQEHEALKRVAGSRGVPVAEVVARAARQVLTFDDPENKNGEVRKDATSMQVDV